MGESQQIARVTISQKTILKIKDVYDFMYDLVTSQGFDVSEKEFIKKDTESSFEWDCYRWVDDYVQFKIWLKCKISEESQVKVKRDGVTEPMIKADVKLVMKGSLITDWQGRWEAKSPILKFLKGLYDHFLFGPMINEKKKALIDMIYINENEVKSFFELPRYM